MACRYGESGLVSVEIPKSWIGLVVKSLSAILRRFPIGARTAERVLISRSTKYAATHILPRVSILKIWSPGTGDASLICMDVHFVLWHSEASCGRTLSGTFPTIAGDH